MENEMVMYNGKVWGTEVSKYGIEHGRLDYRALSGLVGDHILNNTILDATYQENWELVNGDDENIYEVEFYQYYIVSERGYTFLREYTNEYVYYNEDLDIYLWAITHFGTGWDYVLTDVEFVDGDKIRRSYEELKKSADGFDAIYGDFIVSLIGEECFDYLRKQKRLVSCGSVNGRSLYTLD